MDEINLLTKELQKQGYTRDNYPNHVYCGDWKNYSYKFEHLKTLVWESPCGLLTNEIAIGKLWNENIEYCAENNNPLFSCPYHGKLNGCACKHYKKGFPTGITCKFHLTDKPYNYDSSIEKLWFKTEERVKNKVQAKFKGYYCYLCHEIDPETLVFTGKYNVEGCIEHSCINDFCPVRNKPRDLTKVNVFYDVLRTWNTKQGFLKNTRSEIEKGVRVFPKAVAKTDAEIWLKIKNAKEKFYPFTLKLNSEERMYLYFTKMHRLEIEGYEYFEFTIVPQNFRISKSAGRDLEQDLKDIADGIKVIHKSDKDKVAKEIKKQNREKYQIRKKLKSNSKKERNRQLQFF